MNSLEIIRKACNEANPEIRELKFGCLVDLNDNHKKETAYAIVTDEKLYFPRGIDYDQRKFETTKGQVGPELRYSFYKVLGRPIRLSDIIFTLYKNKKAQYFGGMLDDNSIYFANRIGWNLLHDDIELQSQPTKDFIAGLLKEIK
jgi:hypothetical protein